MNFMHSSAYMAPEQAPTYTYVQQPPPFYQLQVQLPPQMLSPQTSAAVSTPSLVSRSLTSSPSTSATREDEIYRAECGPDDARDVATAHALTSFSFDTEDSSQPWFTGKTLLPHPRDLKAVSSALPPPPFIPNPFTLKYTPTITRRRYAADPLNCERVNVPWRPNHAWLRPLRAGGVAQASQARRGYAKDIVNAGPWDTSLISELAAKFIERAAEGQSPDSACVAPFAQDVYNAFRDRHGDTPAEIFAQQLRQCLLSEFRAWWLQDMPSSIYNLPRRTCSPPHGHPYAYLSSALAVAEFAGDLFAYSLAAPHYLLLCVNMLLDRLSIFEEVCALHAILHHAGEGMYSRLQTSDFVGTLQRRAARISDSETSVGHPNVVSEIARLVEDIKRLVTDWRDARATPSPSECSDLSSEYSDHNPDLANCHSEPAVSPSLQDAAPAVIPPCLTPEPSEAEVEDKQEIQEEVKKDEHDSLKPQQRFTSSPRTIRQSDYRPVPRVAAREPSESRDCATPIARLAEPVRSWADIVKA